MANKNLNCGAFIQFNAIHKKERSCIGSCTGQILGCKNCVFLI